MKITVTDRQRQWLWFIALWLCGFAFVGAISLIVRMIMGIA